MQPHDLVIEELQSLAVHPLCVGLTPLCAEGAQHFDNTDTLLEFKSTFKYNLTCLALVAEIALITDAVTHSIMYYDPSCLDALASRGWLCIVQTQLGSFSRCPPAAAGCSGSTAPELRLPGH